MHYLMWRIHSMFNALVYKWIAWPDSIRPLDNSQCNLPILLGLAYCVMCMGAPDYPPRDDVTF